MSNFLNLHLHTRYSDGCNTVEEMAVWIRDCMKHDCLVTSDHDYMMTPEKYAKQLAESAEISARLEFPIINALEISLWTEEAVLVGTEACCRWLAEREKPEHKVLVKSEWSDEEDIQIHAHKMFPACLEDADYALCLVHPTLGEELNYGIFHAYEIMNSGSVWPVEEQARMREMMPRAKPVRGMDAHGTAYPRPQDEERQGMYPHFFQSRNTIDRVITTEAELIRWIKES